MNYTIIADTPQQAIQAFLESIDQAIGVEAIPLTNTAANRTRSAGAVQALRGLRQMWEQVTVVPKAQEAFRECTICEGTGMREEPGGQKLTCDVCGGRGVRSQVRGEAQ